MRERQPPALFRGRAGRRPRTEILGNSARPWSWKRSCRPVARRRNRLHLAGPRGGPGQRRARRASAQSGVDTRGEDALRDLVGIVQLRRAVDEPVDMETSSCARSTRSSFGNNELRRRPDRPTTWPVSSTDWRATGWNALAVPMSGADLLRVASPRQGRTRRSRADRRDHHHRHGWAAVDKPLRHTRRSHPRAVGLARADGEFRLTVAPLGVRDELAVLAMCLPTSNRSTVPGTFPCTSTAVRDSRPDRRVGAPGSPLSTLPGRRGSWSVRNCGATLVNSAAKPGPSASFVRHAVHRGAVAAVVPRPHSTAMTRPGPRPPNAVRLPDRDGRPTGPTGANWSRIPSVHCARLAERHRGHRQDPTWCPHPSLRGTTSGCRDLTATTCQSERWSTTCAGCSAAACSRSSTCRPRPP